MMVAKGNIPMQKFTTIVKILRDYTPGPDLQKAMSGMI